MRDHPVGEFLLRAKTGMLGDLLADEAAHRSQPAALVVFLVRAGVADMREGEGDDLAVVGGIGHHLLIAGHRGVEADLAHRAAGGAEALAPDAAPVGEDDDSGGPLRLRVRRCGTGHGRSGVRGFGNVC